MKTILLLKDEIAVARQQLANNSSDRPQSDLLTEARGATVIAGVTLVQAVRIPAWKRNLTFRLNHPRRNEV